MQSCRLLVVLGVMLRVFLRLFHLFSYECDFSMEEGVSWGRFAAVSVVSRFEFICHLPLLLETLDKSKILLVISYLLLLVSSISCMFQEYYNILYESQKLSRYSISAQIEIGQPSSGSSCQIQLLY